MPAGMSFAATTPAAPQLYEALPGNVILDFRHGDTASVEAAFASAAHVLEAAETGIEFSIVRGNLGQGGGQFRIAGTDRAIGLMELADRLWRAGCAGSLPSVMNALVDTLSVYGIRHIDMPATPRVWGGGPGRRLIMSRTGRARG